MKLLSDLSKVPAWNGVQAASKARVSDVALPFPIDGAPADATCIRYDQRNGENWTGRDEPNRERCETSCANQEVNALEEGVEYEDEFSIAFASSWPRSGSDWLIFRQYHLIGGLQPVITFYGADGVVQLKTSTGGNHTTRWGEALVPGRFVRYRLRYRLSRSTKDGYVELARDGETVLPPTPAATLPASPQFKQIGAKRSVAYLKQGSYRSADYAGDTEVYAYRSLHGLYVPETPPPPPSDPCASIRATLAQTVSDLNGAREARDQAIEGRQVAIAERDELAATISRVRAAIDGVAA